MKSPAGLWWLDDPWLWGSKPFCEDSRLVTMTHVGLLVS